MRRWWLHHRNYAVDERGCWYFQNGPQRVYVQLEATPYIVRTDPAAGWLLHTGAPLGTPEAGAADRQRRADPAAAQW
jgi:hypothetical protein